MSTEQTPAQWMEFIGGILNCPQDCGECWDHIDINDVQFLYDRCRKLELCLSAIIVGSESTDMRSLIAGAKAALGGRDGD